MERKKLGEILVEAGLISREILDTALVIQQGKNKRLGKILIELGYVNGDQVAETLSRQLSLPLVKLEDYPVTPELLGTIPKQTAEEHMVFPLELKGRRLLLAMADPCNWRVVDDLSFKTGLQISMVVASEASIVNAIETHYCSTEHIWDLIKGLNISEPVEFVSDEPDERAEEMSVQSLFKSSEAPPIIKLVTMIIADAVNTRTSDIHIEPRDDSVLVRYRIDGELRNALRFPKHIQESVVSRIKIISNLDITNRRRPQDGRSSLRVGAKSIDLRISTLPSVFGEKIVIRLLDRTAGIIPLSKFNLQEQMLSQLVEIVSRPQGMVLVTGPTGSGKTTMLYAILQQLQTEKDNLISIEDPVEYRLPGITQVGVNEAVGLTFAMALRSILRQDPDIIMVGEIRDGETAEIAARAALTGHMLFSTLHTNDTVASIIRLLDIGLEPFLISSALTGVLAQRLLRRICPTCLTRVSPPEELLKPFFPPLDACYKGTGCKECQNTGYLGRVGVYEFLPITARLSGLIARRAAEEEFWGAAREAGTITLFEDAWDKVNKGLTTVEEVLSKIPYHQVAHGAGRVVG